MTQEKLDKLESIGIHDLTIPEAAHNWIRVQFSFPKDKGFHIPYHWYATLGQNTTRYERVRPGRNQQMVYIPPNTKEVKVLVGLSESSSGGFGSPAHKDFWSGIFYPGYSQKEESARGQSLSQDDLASLRSRITELEKNISDLKVALYDHIKVDMLTDSNRLREFIELGEAEEIRELRDQINNIEVTRKKYKAELAAEINRKLSDFEARIEEKPKSGNTLEEISQTITDLKVEDLKKRILQDQSEILASREIDAEERRTASKNLDSILEELMKLRPASWQPEDEDCLKKLLGSMVTEIDSMQKRIEGLSGDPIAKELENLCIPRFDDSTSLLGDLGEVSFLDDSWRPTDPLAAYQERVDQSLINVRSKYLGERERVLSIFLKDGIELGNAMDEFVSEVVFPFTETTLKEIQEWHEGLEGGRGRSTGEIEEVKKNIWRLSGIEEIPVREEQTRFDENLHHKIDEEIHENLPKKLVLKVRGKGYRIASSNKIIRKARVIVNERF